MGFPGGSDNKEFTCNAGDSGPMPGWGRSPGGGHATHSRILALKNPHGQRSMVGYSPWGHKELDTTEWLSTYVYIYIYIYTNHFDINLIYYKLTIYKFLKKKLKKVILYIHKVINQY